MGEGLDLVDLVLDGFGFGFVVVLGYCGGEFVVVGYVGEIYVEVILGYVDVVFLDEFVFVFVVGVGVDELDGYGWIFLFVLCGGVVCVQGLMIVEIWILLNVGSCF